MAHRSPVFLLIAIAILPIGFDAVAAQRRAESDSLEFRGRTRCLSDQTGYDWIGGVLIVPKADGTQRRYTEADGSFSFTLPGERVRGLTSAFASFGLRQGAAVIDSIMEIPPFPLTRPMGEIYPRTRIIGAGIVTIPARCDSIESPRGWQPDRLDALLGRVVFDEPPELELTGEKAMAKAGAGLTGILRAVRNFAARAIGRYNLATVTFAVDTLSVDTVRIPVHLDRRGRFLSLPYNLFSDNIGFLFAPGEVSPETPLWNPAAMLLATDAHLGMRSDHAGFFQAGGVLRLNDRTSLGAFVYRFRRGSLRFCELIDPHSVELEVAPFESVPAQRTEEVCVPHDDPAFAQYEAADEERYLRDRIPADPAGPVRLDDMVERLGLRERVVGVSAAVRVNSRLAVGLTGKYLHRDAEVVPEVTKVVVEGVSITGPMTLTDLSASRESRETDGFDLDIGALLLVGRARLGVSLMDVLGRQVPLQDGSGITSRTVGVGMAFNLGPVDAGMDSRFHAWGAPDLSAGLSLRLLDAIQLHAGYADAVSSWSAGVNLLGATYTFAHGGSLGHRHMTGMRMSF